MRGVEEGESGGPLHDFSSLSHFLPLFAAPECVWLDTMMEAQRLLLSCKWTLDCYETPFGLRHIVVFVSCVFL